MKEQSREVEHGSFRRFLRAHRWQILLILLLALAVRSYFIYNAPKTANDSLTRYLPMAINILDGNGFSTDTSAPFRPGVGVVPLYPLFIAANYALFGRHEVAVKVSQALLDLSTALLVAYISFNMASSSLRSKAAISALIIYGVFSWFTLMWTSYILTETLAIFLTTLTIALCMMALRRGGWFWFYAGAACGLCILTRPDSMLLAAAILLFLAFRAARERSWRSVLYPAIFSLAVMLALLPWTARNYFSLGEFQPLASEYGFPQQSFMPTGYLWWIRTWMIDETYFEAFNPAFAPPGKLTYDPEHLPESAFDSPEERQRVESLIERFNQTRRFTPELDEEFRRLAFERIKRAPLRFFVVLPFYRAASLWLTGFSTSSPLRRLLRILAVLPILIGGAVGLIVWGRSRVGALLLFVIATRTLFLAYHYAPETRYIVEAYPVMIAACGVSLAALLTYARSRKSKRALASSN